MTTPLNILILEDSPSDADLIVAELRRAGFDPKWKCVETEPAFLAELKNLPDIILSDYSMPQFSGLRAVELLQESGLNIPFILISGTVGEEIAVEAMRHGATDYLLKDRIARLGMAVKQAQEKKQLYEQQKQAEEALRQSREEFKDLFDNAPVGFHEVDAEGRIVRINNTALKMLGYSAEELLGQFVWKITAEEEVSRKAVLAKLSGKGTPEEVLEKMLRRKDGSTFPVIINNRLLKRGGGAVTGIRATIQDITDRKQAEEKLRAHEANLAEAQRVARLGSWQYDCASNKVRWSDELFRIFDVEPAKFHGTYEDFVNCVLPDDRPRVIQSNAHAKANGSSFELEYRILTRVGDLKTMHEIGYAMKDAGGKVVGLFGTAQDITERKRAEELLARERNLLRLMLDTLPGYIYLKDEQSRFIVCNSKRADNDAIQNGADLIGKTDADIFPPGQAAQFRADELAVLAGTPLIDKEEILIRSDGSQQILLTSKLPFRDSRGKIIGLFGYGYDITKRKQAEEELRESELKFRQIAENIREVFWVTDPAKQQMVYVSPAYENIWGRTCQSLYDAPGTWLEAIHPDDRERVLEAALTKQTIETSAVYDEEYRIIKPDKTVIWIHDRAFPIRNGAGEIYRIVGIAEDITEKRKLEEQFRQSQKMEAFGQLAGGVAHDFNNILAVIQLQAGLLKLECNLAPELYNHAGDIEKAAERGANLTRQLLLFSRKQTMQPRDLKLKDLVANIARMLQPALGEQVELKFKFSDEDLVIHADPGMIDQLLLNLAVNARDAMPSGGQIRIETSSVEFDEVTARRTFKARPGSFVCLSVTDTGYGISPEILPLIFEPFFTTKEVGKGTGLGLATVLGIVQQHKGWINVQSEVGRGTTFRVFLPRLSVTVDTKFIRFSPASLRGGDETILLVEDEALLRASVRTALSRLGYRVLEAATGNEALAVWQQHRAEIRLLLTDMVMPGGMTGKELAAQLLQQNPKLKVIYASGYSLEVAGKDFPLEEGINFLNKPFQAQKLAKTVRRCLDQD
jgi:two-component system, cell cycle sensor histidine kinase and response regulator CckA